MTQVNNEVAKPIINNLYEEPRRYYVIERGKLPLPVADWREPCWANGREEAIRDESD